ncbi:POU domain, class 6, transcription factor 2 [Hypsibius exemplaris]|uniref:POU domain protein n=1 Tax=Hypsibius exemplaris TaxID=2072580 RepID=A0A1W0WHG8_HYPEX|nr:POU domain, class 6, transcription factor 2 [Hypsibius exemplaris]
MEAQSSGSPGSESSSPISSTSTDAKLPSVQQILPSLLGLHNWSLGSALSQATSQNPNQAHNHTLSRNSSAAATQFLLANQALQGFQAQQFLQMPSSNSSGQLMSVPVNAASQAQMILNNNHILTSALAGLSNNNSQNSQNGVALVNHFQMQQLLNSGMSSNQLLSALNNQLLANAAAQSGLQFSQSGMMGQSVIRRVGKAPSSIVDSTHTTSGSSFNVKTEDSDDDAEDSVDNSENGMDDDTDDRSSDRGPTIAQLTSSTASVIRSTKGPPYAQTGKSSTFINSTKKSQSPPTSTSSLGSAMASSSPTNIRHIRQDKSVICTARSAASNVVDGIDLEEIREFAKRFKMRRLSLGLTQTQVGQALSATEGPSYSQSAICRFEKLDITPRSAQKIKPVLERWMKEAEERYENGGQNLAEFVGCEPNKKRKRRTSFTPQALEILNVHFEKNTHPSGAEVTTLADELNYDREVVRVWFCNKRQALKNTIKKIKNSGA